MSDGLVVTRAKMINIKAEMKKRKLAESDFEAVFLNYKTPGGVAEGLFFISKSFSNLQSRINSDFSVQLRFPNHAISSVDSGTPARMTPTSGRRRSTPASTIALTLFPSAWKIEDQCRGHQRRKLVQEAAELGANTKTLSKHIDKEKARAHH